MSAPRYRPRESLRTRRSGEEIDASDPAADLAATGIDRPVADQSDLRRAALMERVERERRRGAGARRSRRRLVVGAIVGLTIALAVGIGVGILLATT